MLTRANAYLRHQHARFLRPDAARWIRPDAAKFLKPGTRLTDVYPAFADPLEAARRKQDRAIADDIAQVCAAFDALRAKLRDVSGELARRRADRKYSDDQPRVPAGNGRPSGRWSDASYGNGDRPRVQIYRTNPEAEEVGDGGSGISLPMGLLDFGDIANEIGNLDLFDITPRERITDGVQLAGDPRRGIGDNGGPPLEPPEIPESMPGTSEERMRFVRRAVAWIARRALAADIFLGALDRANDLKRLTDMIKTANDPPRTLDELQRQIGKPGYHRHHIAEEAAARDAKDSERLIQGPNNLAGVPILKHIDITAEYNRKVEQSDGRKRSPRELLKDRDFETRRQYGLDVMRRHGVLK